MSTMSGHPISRATRRHLTAGPITFAYAQPGQPRRIIHSTLARVTRRYLWVNNGTHEVGWPWCWVESVVQP